MNVLILSGGSGTRLWPLSTEKNPKQYVKIIKDLNGIPESMIQRMCRLLLEKNEMFSSLSIVTEESQVQLLEEQLQSNWKPKLILEPKRRDTFPAIMLAASYLYDIEGISEDEVVCLLPVDSYVNDDFFTSVYELETVIQKTGANIVLMGVKPTSPQEKYGYILPEKMLSTTHNYSSVVNFVEKPGRATAEDLISKGALWNCGVFAVRLGYLLSIMKEKGLPLEYQELRASYEMLPRISFDYEVVEKEDKIAVMSYSGEWKDLGTWDALTEELDEEILGLGYVSKDSLNTHIINELEIPINVIGLSDIVVVGTEEGILIGNKEKISKSKAFTSEMKKNNP
ncbi:sugar phosphate nucleotidyltransferase [Bacillus weihaiensis]|uniref:Nucleotidyl transferase domain-containing protein n=1 Tax=Bacillus weihaiensis TaxID=1547283 RepID=A0A1L3MW88_9BACI|nr:sugar phosphate nucleotidyltransferase [Bacillus weihaiensis]APH06592.1 hypothetical protein A9C19_18785 [Bacillus weihaiensis]